jgi:site-specific recombinase XerD
MGEKLGAGLLYSSQLRIGELLNVKSEDVDSKRMLVVCGKGKANGQTTTSIQ